MIQVIDNFLPENDFLPLYDMLTSVHFAWNYHTTNLPDGPYAHHGYGYEQMVHVFYNYERVQSENIIFVEPIIEKLDVKKLLRVKANMVSPRVEDEEVPFHTDLPEEYNGVAKTAVYYLNDNDGFTIFENGDIIESKANRIAIFPCEMLHGLKRHTKGKNRIAINLNWIYND